MLVLNVKKKKKRFKMKSTTLKLDIYIWQVIILPYSSLVVVKTPIPALDDLPEDMGVTGKHLMHVIQCNFMSLTTAYWSLGISVLYWITANAMRTSSCCCITLKSFNWLNVGWHLLRIRRHRKHIIICISHCDDWNRSSKMQKCFYKTRHG